MKLLRKERLENCLPSAPEYRYEFSAPWSPETIRRLGELGQLDYYSHFPRPFFRVRLREGAVIRGVEGDACCRVMFAADDALLRQQFDTRLARCLSRPGVNSQGGHEWE